GWRLVLDPVWNPGNQQKETVGFTFYLFADETFRPPAVVRLGKKGCPIRLEWEEIASAVGVFIETPVRPTHAINPLDIQGEILSYEPLSIPPHLVFRVAEIRNDWFVFADEHRVQVPKRLIAEKIHPETSLASSSGKARRSGKHD
ncbi:MAG: hypothetical protein AB7P69_23990, partial [Candidatus Binatia bacterium]